MIPYIGGKSYLANWIISEFPKDYEQLSYCEVFGGAGWVLFKKEPSNLETYNDLNKNLVNLFRIIRDNYKEFEHRAEWSLHSREMYQEARAKLKDDKFLNDLEKAMYYALDRVQAFSGQGGWAYAVTVKKVRSGSWNAFLKRLSVVNARLKQVQIECLDFEKLIEKYDSKSTLFYLDPPYVGVEHYYNVPGVHFSLPDHKRLASMLKQISGKFVLSYYEHELIRKYYKKFNISEKNSVKHSCGSTKASGIKEKPKSIELLIKNY